MAEYGMRCRVCYGDSLSFENGVLVCDQCGTQTQVVQEETEYQQGVDDTRGRRRAGGSSAAAAAESRAAMLAREEETAAQQLQAAALTYLRCLQHLLQAQAEALSSSFGVSGQVGSVLRQLWLAHLPATGLLESTAHQLAAAAAGGAGPGLSRQQQQQHGGDADGDEDMPDAHDGGQQQQQQQQSASVMVQPHNMRRLFWKLLHPQTTLQMCFVGCVLLREAVTFYDIITWALDGQLPFLDLPSLAASRLTEAELYCLPVRVIQPLLEASPAAFSSGCCRLAASLGLQLPPVAAEPLLLRAVTELALPQIVYDVAAQLHFLYNTGSARMRLQSSSSSRSESSSRAASSTQHVQPYTWLAAELLVAIKLLYGLGNAVGQAALVPKAAGPPQGWQAWARGVLARAPGITSMPLTDREVAVLDPGPMQEYLSYCRNLMFAGQPCVPGFDDMQRLLLGWFDAATAAWRAASQQQQQQGAVGGPRQPPSVADTLAGAAAAREAGATPGSARQQQHQQQEPEQQQEQQQQQDLASTKQEPPPGWASYILALGGGGGTRGGSYRLEPDLAAIAVAVAAHSHISPEALLECVRALERQMLSVEAGVRLLKGMQELRSGAETRARTAKGVGGGSRSRAGAAGSQSASARRAAAAAAAAAGLDDDAP